MTPRAVTSSTDTDSVPKVCQRKAVCFSEQKPSTNLVKTRIKITATTTEHLQLSEAESLLSTKAAFFRFRVRASDMQCLFVIDGSESSSSAWVLKYCFLHEDFSVCK